MSPVATATFFSVAAHSDLLHGVVINSKYNNESFISGATVSFAIFLSFHISPACLATLLLLTQIYQVIYHYFIGISHSITLLFQLAGFPLRLLCWVQ
jgi:hypothetical protein